MSDLVTFLRARLDDDERTAKAAAFTGTIGQYDLTRWDWHVCWDCGISTEDAAHLNRHDPARVLAEVKAKRAILTEHQDVNDGDCCTCVRGNWGYPTNGGSTPLPWPCPTLRYLAAVYADHPDYRQEWTP